MAINNLNEFLYDYFAAHHCNILSNQSGILHVKLTEEMDRALMNRPFYWHYIKKIGQPGEPMELTLITEPSKNDVKGEWIHFGSPRLQQITNHLKNNEKHTKLFQKMETGQKTALFPWLVMNIKISYCGKQKKDEMISIGLQLINGSMRLEMMEMLKEIELQTTISDFCYTISPIIMPKSGYRRMENVIEGYIKEQEHDWADASLKTMQEEIDLVKHFYRSDDGDREQEMQKEIDEIRKRYDPYITFEPINGGLFYLAQ
ncbi:YqhG family protein [Virgibacillus siamensis]|uniref:YqhG family protein n=1 Tax=Virgibacillus siamensis TaxID=480071 RepID=UPI0009848E23|nr:YqhG family protein [Virgibacillus siamensis]